MGDDLEQAEAVRTVFDAVVDDSGRNLLDPSESKSAKFENLVSGCGRGKELAFTFKNSDRKAIMFCEKWVP